MSLVNCLLFGFVVAQRHGRVQETQLKCTKARNDYLLNLAAANAAMNKYYLQDVSTLIDVRSAPCRLCPSRFCIQRLPLGFLNTK